MYKRQTLGLSGVCDVVEFSVSSDGVCLPSREGRYQPAPVEYKRGKPKKDACNEAQLCAQAICLEEMLAFPIPVGCLYYAQTRRRVEVEFSEELRELVHKAAHEMHAYHQRGYTPRVKTSKACRACSLADVCLPDLQEQPISAAAYISQQIKEV